MLKKLTVSLILGLVSVTFAKTFYADNTNSFSACIAPTTIFSVDVPCNIKTISYSDNMKGSINAGSPHSAFFMVLPHDNLMCGLKKNCKDDRSKSASFVVACKDQSFSFHLTVDKSCTDNHFEVMLSKPINPSGFSKQELLNLAGGLMRSMIKGQIPFGFRREPVNVTENIYGSPFLQANIYEAYTGGPLIGFVGQITNTSPVVPQTINVPTFMQKGWILLYMDTPNFRTDTVINPRQTVYFYVVAEAPRTHGRYPYKGNDKKITLQPEVSNINLAGKSVSMPQSGGTSKTLPVIP